MWYDRQERSGIWKLQYNTGSDGKIYIRVVASNGKIVARSNRGYDNENLARAHFRMVRIEGVFSGTRVATGGYTAWAGDALDREDRDYFYSEVLTSKAYAQSVAEKLAELIKTMG